MIAFDANVALGRFAASRGRSFPTAAALLETLDFLGIQRALVHSTLARQSDPMEGNRLLLEATAGHPRLEPCWVAIPHREEPRTLLARLGEHGIRAVRLFPTSGHFSIAPECLGEFASALAESGRLLLIDFEGPSWADSRVEWSALYALCQAHPGLKILLCGVPMSGPANYRALLKSCPNLHLEISQMVTPGELAHLARSGYAARLVFGSGLPLRHAGAALALVEKSGLGVADCDALLHGNLTRLLGSAPLGAHPTLRPAPAHPGVVDTHVHLGGWAASAAASGRPEETVADMDRCGVETAIATSLWACYGEVCRGNADVAQAGRRFPGRLYGYLTLDPKHPAEAEAEIARYAADPVFRGIKLHEETHGFRIEEPCCEPILRHADARGLPVLVHGRPDADLWERLCTSYPGARFILAHVGGMGPDHAEATRFAARARSVPNLYFDLAATRNFPGFLEELIDLAGAEKILYGSDYPLMDFGFELGQILHAPLREADRALILHGNARRLFHL